MPVFTAFGWAGEETAIKYALSQLELFVQALHAALPGSLQAELPVYGLSEETRSVYLAADREVESNIFIAFLARPMSLELQLGLTNKDVLTKGYKQIAKDSMLFYRMLKRMGPEWSLRIQQIHVNEETGEQGHYADLYKESLGSLDESTAAELFERAAYLNSEAKWIIPIYVSLRTPSEQAAAMGLKITDVMAEHIGMLRPIFQIMSGRAAGSLQKQASQARKKATSTTRRTAPVPADTIMTDTAVPVEAFSYVAELQPLHLRRGFINLTPAHWPFFSINARTETRPVIVLAGGIRDKESAVWRLQPGDMARLVLSPRLHNWLGDNYVAGDRVQVLATKSGDDIEITLTPA